MGFSLINHLFWGTTHSWKPPYSPPNDVTDVTVEKNTGTLGTSLGAVPQKTGLPCSTSLKTLAKVYDITCMRKVVRFYSLQYHIKSYMISISSMPIPIFHHFRINISVLLVNISMSCWLISHRISNVHLGGLLGSHLGHGFGPMWSGCCPNWMASCRPMGSISWPLKSQEQGGAWKQKVDQT